MSKKRLAVFDIDGTVFRSSLLIELVNALMYGLDNRDQFDGTVLFEDLIMNKARIVERVLDKEPVTLRGSVGVGDTESDIPFLKMVDKPICFNPNRKLFGFVRKSGWPIVVERKDVVYRINGSRV